MLKSLVSALGSRSVGNRRLNNPPTLSATLSLRSSGVITLRCSAETVEFAAFVCAKMRDDDVEMTSAESASAGSGSTDGGESSPATQTAKARKPTYIARKEEKESLMKEVEELQIKLQKQQETGNDVLQYELETSLLRDAVRMQGLSLVNVQSAVSSYVSVIETIPHEVTICLGKDPVERRDSLLVIKQKKIHASLTYLSVRTRFLDPFRPISETSRFLLDGGDYCALIIDRTPFDASKVSVRQLYDSIASYLSNMEMRVMDLLGDVTTCDETDYGVDGIQQSRYESSVSCGIRLEKNTVRFQEFTDQSKEYGDGGPLGVFTTDFVDVDELYPYRPHQCVRLDITMVMTVRMHTRQQVNPATGCEEDENVVVWTRSYFGKLRHTETPLPPLVEHSLREHIGKWGDVMMSTVLEQIYSHQAAV